MKSIRFHLAKPFKENIHWADVRELKRAGKSIQKCLSEESTIIYLTLTFPNRKVIRVNTHEKIKPVWWNFDSQSVKSQMHGSLELNDRLHFLKAEATRQYRKLITANPSVTLEDIKEMAENVVAGSVPDFERKPMIDCLKEFIEERRPHVNELTTIKYEVLVRIIDLWMQGAEIKSKNFFCDHVDQDFEFSFKNFLINRKVTNNTMGKYVECIVKFMRWARKKEYHNTTAFEDFEITHTPAEIIWLDENELQKLESCQPEQKHMKRTQKLFLFMIFTGQRYADYKNLKKRHIVVNHDGTMDWELYQRKGTKTRKTVIPLITKAIDVLKEFGFDSADTDDYLLPVPCNQFLNRQIKDLCEFAGIDSPITLIKTIGNQRIEENFKKFEVVSCHTSRKTWVSLSMMNGLGMEYITSVTGHQQIRTLRAHYLGLSEKARRDAINNAWRNKQVGDSESGSSAASA